MRNLPSSKLAFDKELPGQRLAVPDRLDIQAGANAVYGAGFVGAWFVLMDNPAAPAKRLRIDYTPPCYANAWIVLTLTFQHNNAGQQVAFRITETNFGAVAHQKRADIHVPAANSWFPVSLSLYARNLAKGTTYRFEGQIQQWGASTTIASTSIPNTNMELIPEAHPGIP